MKCLHRLKSFGDSAGIAAMLKIGLPLKHVGKSLPDHRMIIHDQNARSASRREIAAGQTGSPFACDIPSFPSMRIGFHPVSCLISSNLGSYFCTVSTLIIRGQKTFKFHSKPIRICANLRQNLHIQSTFSTLGQVGSMNRTPTMQNGTSGVVGLKR